MKKITLRDVIRSVPERWAKQYPDGRRYGSDKLETLRKLRGLDVETATRETISTIIGNDLWTEIECDECGAKNLDVAIMVGEQPDCESSTAIICLSCLKKAVECAENE